MDSSNKQLTISGSLDTDPQDTRKDRKSHKSSPSDDDKANNQGSALRSSFSIFVSEFWIYAASALVTAGVLTVMMRLWRADWEAPFFRGGDATSSAAHFRTTIDTGWYEYTAKLGAPYGQHYQDFPFSDDLHPAMAKILGLFTNETGIAVNVYYVFGFIIAALTSTWFLRRCGLSAPMTVCMATLYAVAPYHFSRNETHLFLASYYCVPLALGLVYYAAAGRALWGRRVNSNKALAYLTGKSVWTFVILTTLTLSSAYYAVFAGILMAAAGLFAFVRDRKLSRLGGVILAGAILVVSLIGAMIPDILFASVNGTNSASFVRIPAETELYSLKFTSLILPAAGHRIQAFADLNQWYTSQYPLPGESPALGAVAACGFLILMLIIPVQALASKVAATDSVLKLRQLSYLTYVAFLTATIGGLGTLVSLFITDSIRGWNRLSIFIALLSLAAFGLILDQASIRLHRAVPRLRALNASVAITLVAVAILMLGSADQSLKTAVPDYQAASEEWRSTDSFVKSLESTVPADAMIFQLPYMPFPESGPFNGLYGSDQLNLYLHNSDLRWSGGGMKGRPQSDWPAGVAAEEPATMTSDLAAIGFQGIVVDRAALADSGAELEGQLTPILGAPTLISPDQRYAFLSLQPVIDQLDATTSTEERAAIASAITHIAPAG